MDRRIIPVLAMEISRVLARDSLNTYTAHIECGVNREPQPSLLLTAE